MDQIMMIMKARMELKFWQVPAVLLVYFVNGKALWWIDKRRRHYWSPVTQDSKVTVKHNYMHLAAFLFCCQMRISKYYHVTSTQLSQSSFPIKKHETTGAGWSSSKPYTQIFASINKIRLDFQSNCKWTGNQKIRHTLSAKFWNTKKMLDCVMNQFLLFLWNLNNRSNTGLKASKWCVSIRTMEWSTSLATGPLSTCRLLEGLCSATWMDSFNQKWFFGSLFTIFLSFHNLLEINYSWKNVHIIGK